jgi:fructuronate reductase
VRLSEQALPLLSGAVERFAYDRKAQAGGIVHLGIGAFHRAHQAWYTDRAMDAGDRDWAITGVSLRSGEIAARMNPQDGLYTLTERGSGGDAIRLIGSVRRVLVAPVDGEAVTAAIAAPETRIVSLTVTEKGYCRAPDGALDANLAGDGSLYGALARALSRRRAAGLPGVTLLSCDNLANNGAVLDALMRDYLDRVSPELRQWFERECACPSSMVDRIVPAATDADRAAAASAIGLEDQGAVVAEPFSQWVIEDRFAQGRPAWDRVGAQLVADVAPYEAAKLRMLNGAHSLMAYCGLGQGLDYVHEAIADPLIRPLAERLLREEAAASLNPAPGQDLPSYADSLLVRFANPSLRHRLAQIAMDGSQKLPQRWLETLAQRQRDGGRCPAILAGLAAWLRHVRGDNGRVDDPLAEALKAAWTTAGERGILDAVFGEQGLLRSSWRPLPEDRAEIARLLARSTN